MLAEWLASALADVFPASAHVTGVGLAGAADLAIWERAGTDAFVIVTKDADFQRLSVLRGPPPKVVWVRLGNCTSARVERLLRAHHGTIQAFVADADVAFLELG